jgi:hypothetical protein
MNLKEIGCKAGLDCTSSGQEPLAGFCEHWIEYRVSIERQDVSEESVTYIFTVVKGLLTTCFHACLVLGFSVDPEDGGDGFLRNFG